MSDKTNTNNPFANNLFSNIDLSQDDFLDPNEAKAFDNVFQASKGSNPFENVPAAPVVPIPEPKAKEEEAPVIPVKVTEEKQGKNSKPKKAELSKSIKEQKTARDNMKVDTTWNIAYAAQQYNPPEDDMTLDQVRQWLELDYPELSKERCRMEIDKDKKLIVPIVSGAKKG